MSRTPPELLTWDEGSRWLTLDPERYLIRRAVDPKLANTTRVFGVWDRIANDWLDTTTRPNEPPWE